MPHQRVATAGTNMESVMTIFRPRRAKERWGFRIWNSQFVRFACWETGDGRLLGDPANRHLTQQILRTFPDWQPPAVKTAFDVLPIVIEPPGRPPRLYEVPPEAAALVDIRHPEAASVAALGWKWCAVPTITNFNLRLAGLDFVCCPFNGWFLDLEVARNLLDRYDGAERFLPHFPELQRRRGEGDDSWVDSVFVEINRAVYHSFLASRVTMVNRATITKQFNTHLAREREAGREVPAQWSWIGGLLGPVYDSWKHECRDFARYPQYEYQADKFLVAPYQGQGPSMNGHSGPAEQDKNESESSSPPQASPAEEQASDLARVLRERGVPSVAILYGSETGTAESYARRLAMELRLLSPRVAALNDAATAEGRRLLLEDVVLVITSTFGCGHPPFNAERFLHPDSGPLPDMKRPAPGGGKPVGCAVCAIGSTAYPDFCAFGRLCFFALREAGAVALVDLVTADEMAGQSAAVSGWIESLKLLLLPPELKQALAMVKPADDRLFVRSRPPSSRGPRGQGLESAPAEFLPAPTGQYRLCTVLQNVELRRVASPSDGASTHKIELDVSALGDRPYVTGDHCAVVPVRPREDVVRICDALRVRPSDVIEAVWLDADDQPVVSKAGDRGEGQRSMGSSPSFEYASKTWFQVFSVDVETTLMSHYIGPLLAAMAAARHGAPRGDAPEDPAGAVEGLVSAAARLNEQSLPRFLPSKPPDAIPAGPGDGDEVSAEQVIDRYVTLAGLLSAYPGLAARVDLAELLTLLPKQRPRYYSISSSSLLSPGRIALTVGLVVEKTPLGTVRRGVCSHYLCNVRVGAQVLACIRGSSFRLPADPKTPVVCVGPGTGFAPFAGFLDERAASAVASQGAGLVGETVCFGGARESGQVIYGHEIDEWNKVPSIDVQVVDHAVP